MQLLSLWLVNFLKVLSFRLQRCFGTFAMLFVEVASETWLFRYLSNHVFWSRLFWQYISYEVDLFLESV